MYQYDLDGTYIGSGTTPLLTSDQKTCSGQDLYVTDSTGDTAAIKTVDIDFIFSGFHSTCATFRIGFNIYYKEKQDINALTYSPVLAQFRALIGLC